MMAALLATFSPLTNEAKSYSSGGGRSYSSSSSRSSSSRSSSSPSSSRSSSGSSHTSSSGGSRSSSPGSSKSFSSGSGKSYTARPSSSDSERRSYSSGKSYSAGNSTGNNSKPPPSSTTSTPKKDQGSSSFTYDTAAARAKKEEVSKSEYNKYKESQRPTTGTDASRSVADNSTRSTPVPTTTSSRRTIYVPDYRTISTRPVRVQTVFRPYYSRPVVIYHDPFNSFFWWWLLDRSLDDRAWWAYHHRYDMDPARYQALVAHDQQLEARIAELEARQVARDPSYVPSGLDRDLMYSDNYVANAYSHRRTTSGTLTFWLLGVPTAIAACWFFIWLIWFKRWQTST
jgi:hypothetical protein